MLGKVPPEALAAHVFDRHGATLDSVRQGPAYGEDAAAIQVEDGTLVVSSDPLSLAADRVGTLAVHVACNDVAAAGGDPTWLTNIVFLPGDADSSVLERITKQVDEAAAEMGVAVVGGHSEYNPSLDRPLLTMTCLGMGDPFVPTGGANPGDAVILTKGAGIEGTAILATDFEAELLEAGVNPEIIARAADYYDDIGVTPEGKIVRSWATAMHDPTEGGLIDALLELASASDVALEVDPDAILVREPTATLTDAMDVDPLRIFGSGALLATVPEPDLETVRSALAEADIEAAHIGRVTAGESGVLTLGSKRFTEPVRDDMYRLWE
ncbi:MAG: AIR synthase family protein [Halodesulfurarchaeum sp.]|nr:AIR synthase family protein [Halodesulfurarchaeum sp.]